MKNSPNGKIFYTLKRHSIIAIKLTTISIIIAIISIIVGLYLENPELLKSITKSITSWFMNYPFFWGVIFSWGVAVLSTLIVLSFAYKRGKKGQYKEIFRQSEKWLRGITVVVLFYIAVHLASKAFEWRRGAISYTSGIPIFGEPYAEILGGPYDKLDFFKCITPQDIFLSSLAFWIIFLIFLVAPSIRLREYTLPLLPIPKVSKIRGLWCFSWVRYCRIGTVHLFFILSIVFSAVTAYIVYFCPSLLPFTSILTVPPQNGELSEYTLRGFSITFLISGISFALLWVKIKTKIPKGIKDDFRELLLFFCFMPAIIVASLVLAGDDLVKLPNVFGHIVVGVLLISGFFTLVTIATISFSFNGKPYDIWLCLAFASLMAISGLSGLFLFLHLSQEVPEEFGKILSFAVAIMIMVLLYGFFYEKLQKYRFTEWWRREWKPIAMIISIVMIAIVSVLNPKEPKLYGLPIKLLLIFGALSFVFCLPWILGRLKFKKWKLPKYQGMVLVKAKTDPDSLKEVVKGLDGMEGVYQTMVVRGEYDVCLIVEGVDSYDIEKKILEIRKIRGVANTTTLRDVREFFDREVK
jgi:uncharacterized protein with GYD domain